MTSLFQRVSLSRYTFKHDDLRFEERSTIWCAYFCIIRRFSVEPVSRKMRYLHCFCISNGVDHVICGIRTHADDDKKGISIVNNKKKPLLMSFSNVILSLGPHIYQDRVDSGRTLLGTAMTGCQRNPPSHQRARWHQQTTPTLPVNRYWGIYTKGIWVHDPNLAKSYCFF